MNNPVRESLLDEQRSCDNVSSDALASRLVQLQEFMEDGRSTFSGKHRALRLRQRYRKLFRHAAYRPVLAEGEPGQHLGAVIRKHRQRTPWVAVPRWTSGLLGRGSRLNNPELWSDTSLPWPQSAFGVFQAVFIVRCFSIRTAERISAAKIFATFPLALWIREG